MSDEQKTKLARLAREIQSLMHDSGENITATITVAIGDKLFAKMLAAGEKPPRPANPFSMTA